MTEIYSTEIGIAVAGSVDSGKSTFVGVLTSGKLDNGDGSARMEVAKHPHEKTSKKTSDISTKTVITKNKNGITLFDLCGHEKYFKTTTYGISGHFPDYSFLIIGANRGILPMTKQHITLLMSLNIPIIIIVTRYDITPQNTYNETIKHITNYCKNIIKIPAEIINNPYLENQTENLENASNIAKNILQENRQLFIPVITVSNKNGYYIDFINEFINQLLPRNMWNNFIDNPNMNIEEKCTNRIIKKIMSGIDNPEIFKNFTNNKEHVFFVDTIYNPVGIGIVLTGINRGGIINVGDTLYLGPFGKEFKQVRIKSMNNYAQQIITSANNHQRITVAIASNDKEINKRTVRKGMVLTPFKELFTKNLCFRFDAIITIFSHSSTLKNGYSPSLQIGNVRQSGRLILKPELNQNRDHIKLKEFGYVTFKFKIRPEFIEKYQTFVFRSGCVHGIGIIVNVLPISLDDDAKPDPIKIKLTRKRNIKIK
jgi:elongation factor 1-alpha